MLHLTSGVRIEGDEEAVFRAVDDEQSGGDGLYAADVAEATGLDEERVRTALLSLVEAEVLQVTVADDQLGPRYVKGRAA